MKKKEESTIDGYVPETLGDFNIEVVHQRDARTGRIIGINPFNIIAHNGVKYYEWPKGSGNLWWKNREFAGALGEDGRPVRGKAHKKYEPPITDDERLARENMTLKQQNEKLAKELAEIQNDKKYSAVKETKSANEDKIVLPKS